MCRHAGTHTKEHTFRVGRVSDCILRWGGPRMQDEGLAGLVRCVEPARRILRSLRLRRVIELRRLRRVWRRWRLRRVWLQQLR